MSDQNTSIRDQMIKIGLEDPFIRVIVGMVAIATAASFVVSLLGDGARAILAVGLSLMFGVVLVVLRVLMKNVDSAFINLLCLISSGIIVAVFLSLLIFAVPAVTICWPQVYGQTLGLKACSSVIADKKPFSPVAYTDKAISYNSNNASYLIYVFYRLDRQSDAERIFGALRAAGFKAEAAETSLNEVIAPNRSPGVTLIKATAASRSIREEIDRITKIAIPLRDQMVSIFPDDAPLSRGNVQVDLF